jgi:hypothetical protein
MYGIVPAAVIKSASFAALCTALLIAERSTFNRRATSLRVIWAPGGVGPENMSYPKYITF